MTQKSYNDEDDASKGRKIRERKDKTLTKVVIRCLPASMTSEAFTEQTSPLPEHDYFQFCKADHSLGTAATTRAYINFVSEKDIWDFVERFDGYVFVDACGQEHAAIVEYAPFQKVPKKKSRREDLKSNTIDKDADYLSFLESLASPASDLTATPDKCLEEIEERRKLQAQAGHSTPLTEYLARRHEERAAAVVRAREDRKRKEVERRRAREDERRARIEEERRARESRRLKEERRREREEQRRKEREEEHWKEREEEQRKEKQGKERDERSREGDDRQGREGGDSRGRDEDKRRGTCDEEGRDKEVYESRRGKAREGPQKDGVEGWDNEPDDWERGKEEERGKGRDVWSSEKDERWGKGKEGRRKERDALGKCDDEGWDRENDRTWRSEIARRSNEREDRKGYERGGRVTEWEEGWTYSREDVDMENRRSSDVRVKDRADGRGREREEGRGRESEERWGVEGEGSGKEPQDWKRDRDNERFRRDEERRMKVLEALRKENRRKEKSEGKADGGEVEAAPLTRQYLLLRKTSDGEGIPEKEAEIDKDGGERSRTSSGEVEKSGEKVVESSAGCSVDTEEVAASDGRTEEGKLGKVDNTTKKDVEVSDARVRETRRYSELRGRMRGERRAREQGGESPRPTRDGESHECAVTAVPDSQSQSSEHVRDDSGEECRARRIRNKDRPQQALYVPGQRRRLGDTSRPDSGQTPDSAGERPDSAARNERVDSARDRSDGKTDIAGDQSEKQTGCDNQQTSRDPDSVSDHYHIASELGNTSNCAVELTNADGVERQTKEGADDVDNRYDEESDTVDHVSMWDRSGQNSKESSMSNDAGSSVDPPGTYSDEE